MKNTSFSTRAIHGKTSKADVHHALKMPIYSGVAFEFETAEDLEKAFQGKKLAHAYSRITNPSVEAFEMKMTSLEGGLASIATSSGMSAITAVLVNLFQTGENLIAPVSIFGGTYSLLDRTLRPLGIEPRFVEINDLSAVEHAIDGQTRVLFCETIANPKMNVADLSALSALARRRKLIFVVDGTVTTPVLCDAKRWGIDVMVHSTTKLISGGATSVGGVIVDMGSADWTAIPALGRYHSLKEWAFVARLRKEVYRDLGACLSPYHAYLQSLGLETLALRVNQACANALKIAQTLKADPRIKSVNYPGLPDSPYHELAKAQFNGQFGAILTLELADKPTAFQFLNRLTLIKRATNLGDNTTLAIHPASTIFVEYTKEDREAMGVSDGLVRLSVGIEDSADLLEDLRQALLG